MGKDPRGGVPGSWHPRSPRMFTGSLLRDRGQTARQGEIPHCDTEGIHPANHRGRWGTGNDGDNRRTNAKLDTGSNGERGLINMKLSTIQKREKLNEVYAVDERGNGEAHHSYDIRWDADNNGYISTQRIQLQNGARKLSDSTHGVLDTDLLEIVRHRLRCFQKGPFATRENAIALTHVEEALMWMNRRVEDRIERDVLGTNSK